MPAFWPFSCIRIYIILLFVYYTNLMMKASKNLKLIATTQTLEMTSDCLKMLPRNSSIKSRTSQDMDVSLTLIFAKSGTTWDIITKISAFLQLMKKWILTKFGGCGSKIEPATPISILNFSRAWQSFKVSYALQIWYKAVTHWG